MSDDKIGSEGSEEQGNFHLGESPEDPAAPSADVGSVKKNSGGGGSRVLRLLLLLLVAAGAGFYFFGMDLLLSDDAPVVTSQPPKPSKMKVPVRPQPSQPAEKVPEEVVTKEKVAAVPAPPAAAVAKPKPQPAPKPVEKEPAFALASGSYLYQGSLKKAIAAIEAAGYKVSRSEKPEPHEMTRLLVGRYPRALAEKRLAEVKKLADGAFLAAEEGQFVVYAGSFISLDKARRAADLLYQQGLRVDEMQVTIDLPKTTLRFGQFVTRDEAEAAAKTLEKKGVLDPRVVSLK